MKKVLLVVLVTFIGLTSFAAGNIFKPLPVQTEITTPVVKETKVIKVPKGTKVEKQVKDDCICVCLIYSDGSGLCVCCCDCIIIVVFE